MQSKTPQFDAALDEILNNLTPHTRTCPQKDISFHCMGDFEVFEEDIDMYKKLRVPPPQYCPHCRSQRRGAWMPNLLQFYKKEDVTTGEKILSSQHPQSPYKTVHNRYYFDANAWDALDYGRDYAPDRPLLEQLHELLLAVPHFSIPRFNKNIVNSEYTVDTGEIKNCYFCATLGWCENVMYSIWTLFSRDCVDCLGVDNSENCYENVINKKCTKCFYAQQCFECFSCIFCYDCRNCTDCFGCVNLRNKQYCFFNEQLTKEEYEKKMAEINLGDRDIVEQYKKRFDVVKNKALHRYAYQRQCTNCVGHELGECKGCYYTFWASGSENVRWSSDVYQVKDGMDLTIAGPGELCYNIIEFWDCFGSKNCHFIGQSYDLDYCFECFDCKDCFGCVGLKKKQYCIFNKQYSQKEYGSVVDEIKKKALEAGEYGEFFDLNKVPYAYDDSFSSVLYPITDDEKQSLSVVSYEEESGGSFSEVLEPHEVPADIKDVTDDILDTAIRCEVSGKLFRLIEPELAFYRKNNIPVPTKHPQVRIRQRFAKRNPLKLWHRQCMCDYEVYKNSVEHTYHPEGRCPNEFEASYAPERPEIVYCEACYQREVI